jgi:O-antigen/teichoic acid export membrane protein
MMLKLLAKNTTYMYGAFAVRKISVLLLSVAIARWDGVKGFGLYCLALVLMEFASRLASFGTDILIIRELSSSESDGFRVAGRALAWRTVAAAVTGLGAIAVGMVLNESAAFHRAASVMAVGMLADTLADVYSSVLQGRQRVDLYAVCEGAAGVIGLVLGVASLRINLGIEGLAIAYTLRAVSTLVMSLALCRYLQLSVPFLPDPKAIFTMLKESAPIAASRFLTIAYLGSGTIALQHFHGAAAVGRFACAMKIFETCAAAGMLTMVASFPVIARLRSGSQNELQAAARFLLRFFCWLGIPMSLLVALNAGWILRLLFGPEFAASGPALIILMAAVPFSLVYGLIERLAFAARDQQRVLAIRLVGLLVSLAVLMLLVKPAEYLAPAFAVLAAEAAMCVVFAPCWSRYVSGFSFWSAVVPALAKSRQ